MVMTCFW